MEACCQWGFDQSQTCIGKVLEKGCSLRVRVARGVLCQSLSETGDKQTHVYRCHSPLEIDAKEPGDRAHEINLDSLSKSGLEPFLDGCIGGEVHKIIHVAAYIDEGGGKVRMDANKDTWVMFALLEPHVQEVTSKVVVPVMRRATQSIKSFAKVPVGTRRGHRTSRRRSNDYHFVVK